MPPEEEEGAMTVTFSAYHKSNALVISRGRSLLAFSPPPAAARQLNDFSPCEVPNPYKKHCLAICFS